MPVGDIATRIAMSLVLNSLVMLTNGCGTFVTRAVEDISHQLTLGVQSQEDLALVAEGLPAYLLVLDGMVGRPPVDAKILFGAARLNGLFGGYFAEDPVRKKRFIAKSLDYARRGWCVTDRQSCGIDDKNFGEFERWLTTQPVTRVEELYLLGSSLTAWIQVNSADLSEVAKLAYVEAIFRRVVELDEAHDRGNALAALGILNSLAPAALGGRPDVAQTYFKRALQVAGGVNLMPKVLYAKYYARLVFDQELHDRLLREVLEATPVEDTLRLANTLAKKEARQLVADADEYF